MSEYIFIIQWRDKKKSNISPQPLCMNRRKDNEEWKKEYEQYKIDF
jgi:hypothetical protein